MRSHTMGAAWAPPAAAALLLALFTTLAIGPAIQGLTVPTLTFGGSSAGASVGTATTIDPVPGVDIAGLAACSPGDGRTSCAGVSPVDAAALVGRISPLVGVADGRLTAGSVDRFDLVSALGVLRVSLVGDAGALATVYAGGTQMGTTAPGQAGVSLQGVDPSVTVQIVVENPTDAPRDYRIVLD